MYRRQRSSRPSLIVLLILGALGGLLYLVYDNMQAAAPMPPTPVPQVAAMAVLPESSATPATQTIAIATPGPLAGQSPKSPDIPADSTLFIPSAGIYAPIVQAYLDGVSWDVSRLGMNVGHLQGTAWHSTGNVVLSGHVEMSDGRKGVFATLEQVQVGDLIVLSAGGRETRYEVREISQTDPTDLGPVRPTGEGRLTIITCDDYDFFRNAYLTRTVIVALPLPETGPASG